MRKIINESVFYRTMTAKKEETSDEIRKITFFREINLIQNQSTHNIKIHNNNDLHSTKENVN